jgi:hypothetical protein
MGEIINAYSVLVRKLEGERLLERLRRRWEGNIRTELKEIRYGARSGLIRVCGLL